MKIIITIFFSVLLLALTGCSTNQNLPLMFAQSQTVGISISGGATEQGAEVIKTLIKNHDALILDRHGTLTVGKNLLEAYQKLEKIEYCARVTLVARQLGRIKKLSPEEIKTLETIRKRNGHNDEISLCEQCGICRTDD